MKRRAWTQEQINWLIENSSDYTVKELSVRYACSENQIREMLRRRGLEYKRVKEAPIPITFVSSRAVMLPQPKPFTMEVGKKYRLNFNRTNAIGERPVDPRRETITVKAIYGCKTIAGFNNGYVLCELKNGVRECFQIADIGRIIDYVEVA